MLMSALLVINSFAAVRGDNAAYVGGTASTLKQGLQGVFDTSDPKDLHFEYSGEVAILSLQWRYDRTQNCRLGRSSRTRA